MSTMSTLNYTIPPDARPAASLLLLREGGAGLEVLMMRRAEGDDGDPRSGAAVFPGGRVDAADRDGHRLCHGLEDAALSRRMGLAEGGLDYVVAALRECFEEVGLLAALDDGVAADAAALHGWREMVHAGEVSWAEFCDTQGLRFDLRGLAYYSHWLTPPSVPKRFDTRFFAVRAPAGQLAVADAQEALELMWLTPAQALAPERALKLMPVTRRTLQELQRFDNADAALAEALARTEVPRILPRVARSRRGREVLLPGDPAWAEIGRLDPEGRGDGSCELVSGVAVRLSPRVLRVTAPNPGLMTGPGTNTYLVSAGQARASGWTVIDPGPADPAHLHALLEAVDGVGGQVERILVTHTHADHSPGAAALARATGAPVLGRVAAHPEGQDTSFAPTALLHGGETLALGPGCTLQVLHTPGHASNHLCYRLVEEKLLFTGDQVMQGSTVVINPPDGDMAAYLRALHALLDEDLDWLAPGHGFLVGAPQQVLRGLIAHRLAREAKVLAAVQTAGSAMLDALLKAVYADVPAQLHPVARRSLLAHLLKLRDEGRVECAGDDTDAAWRAC